MESLRRTFKYTIISKISVLSYAIKIKLLNYENNYLKVRLDRS